MSDGQTALCQLKQSLGMPCGPAILQALRDSPFDRKAYRTSADCLNAAYLKGLPLKACGGR
jgi:hypothetical protein